MISFRQSEIQRDIEKHSKKKELNGDQDRF